MGDRGNVVVESNAAQRDDDTGNYGPSFEHERVYLYGHWMGEDNITHAIVGLKSGRGDDAPYLARIILQSMIGSDTGETGFGISASITDNEYPVVVINADEQTVSLEQQANYGGAWVPLSTGNTYEDFIAAADATADEEGDYDKGTHLWAVRIAQVLAAEALKREEGTS